MLQGYGAYLTLMMLKSTDGLFKCSCAVTPVTDWRMYGEIIYKKLYFYFIYIAPFKTSLQSALQKKNNKQLMTNKTHKTKALSY